MDPNCAFHFDSSASFLTGREDDDGEDDQGHDGQDHHHGDPDALPVPRRTV